MPMYPSAENKLIRICNFSKGGNNPRIVVLHIMQGSLAGTDNWFRDPSAQASAHFGVGRDGTIFQWVDTADEAWHAAGGNPYTIGIEHEGYSGQSLTESQIQADAGIVRWANRVHDIPFRITNDIHGSGLGWHGMGGAEWGGHVNCPGQPIVNQREQILKIITDPQPGPGYTSADEEEDMEIKTGANAETAIAFSGGSKSYISFLCDPSRTKSPRPQIRVAVHSRERWYVKEITLVADKQTFDFPTDSMPANGLTVVRAGGDAGDNVPISFNLGA